MGASKQGVGASGRAQPPWRQPRCKSMVSAVNSHTNATRIGWHLWEIDLRFAHGLPPGRLAPSVPRFWAELHLDRILRDSRLLGSALCLHGLEYLVQVGAPAQHTARRARRAPTMHVLRTGAGRTASSVFFSVALRLWRSRCPLWRRMFPHVPQRTLPRSRIRSLRPSVSSCHRSEGPS